MIYILTGEIRTGKTTRLLEWSKTQNSCDGIVSPVLNEKRYLQKISTGEKMLLEATDTTNENNLVYIGKYIFNKNVFEWGKDVLQKLSLQKSEWLILDEIGPLELKGDGFEPISGNLIETYKANKEKLLIVVRINMYNEFLSHYRLNEEEIHLLDI